MREKNEIGKGLGDTRNELTEGKEREKQEEETQEWIEDAMKRKLK